MASSDFTDISGDLHHLSEVSILLLGCRNSGKSSVGNIILGQKEFDLQESARCVKRHGEVAGRKITVVKAPGWWCDKPVEESTKLLKEEIVLSAFQCPPGPRAVLVVVNGHSTFTEKDREILAGYLNLLSDKVWSHTIVLFTVGDSLGDTAIESHIESGGQALQWLVEKCGNRYHVFNKKMHDDAQVLELLEKIEKTIAGNRRRHSITGSKKLRRREEDEKSKEIRRTRGVKYSPRFMNVFVYFFKFLQVFFFSSELDLLPVWSITHSLRLRVDFPGVLQFPPISKKSAVTSSTGTGKDTQSISTLHPDAGHAAKDTELFTPELVEHCPNDKNRDEYRFLCPHAGRFQCKRTNIVFEMEGKGVVVYRVVSWDGRVVDALGHMEPAGPLYGIDCLEGSIRYLLLPHCEIHWGTDVVNLTVAHVTGRNVDLIQPLFVTNTHVIMDVRRQHLSYAGLVKALLFQPYPIKAQVLLFCKETEEHRMSELHIHLLPGNVPVQEVQKRQNSNTYIDTTSECQLTPGKIYTSCCKTTDCDHASQPEDATFDCGYSPRFPPTFKVLFHTEVDQVTLSLLDENGQEVWKPHTVLPTGAVLDVDEHRETINQIVSILSQTGDCSSLKVQHNSTDVRKGFLQRLPTCQKQPTGDMESFVPEMVKSCAEDRNSCKYRFLCPHAGQFMCKLTSLVFEMEGKGVVVYGIVSWDSQLLEGLPQNELAGPLYSIDCPEGSISYLHLPHCETRTDVVPLTVAHVTDGIVEILQPLKITSTHAVVQVHSLSLFGFLKSLLFQPYPIKAQVLLFCKKITGRQSRSKLHIHLLPGNVPVKEVQKQYECSNYVKTTSRCQLTPGKTYRPCCKTSDRDYILQPEDETFDCDFGPNYHHTFEVLFKTEVDEVTLSLLDENGQEVWKPRTVLLTGTEAALTNMEPTGADFVDQHRETLIQRVSSVMEIADHLKAVEVITNEMYYKIDAEATEQGRMRELYKHLDSGGRAVKAEFCKILREKQHYLVTELESASVQA